MILVHGWTCDSTSWTAQVSALSKTYRVVTLDLPETLINSAVEVPAGPYPFGNAAFLGDLESLPPNAPIVGMAATAHHDGYWLGGQDGGVFAFGRAPFYGSTGGIHLNRPIVDMTAKLLGAALNSRR